MYTLRLFGGLALEGPAGPIPGRVAQRRQLALLSLLGSAYPPGRSRDSLAAFLWPEADQERSHGLLSDALYLIRKDLGTDVLVGTGQDLLLNPDRIRTDAPAFEQALEAHDLEKAVTLYTGPFLDGFHASGMLEFERWVETERRRYGEHYAGALERLAESAAAEGELVRASGWWRRAVAQDPYSSRLTLRLMEALARTGDHAAALEAARVHERLLREELELDPSPEIATYLRRLKDQPPSVPASEDRSTASDRRSPPLPIEAPDTSPVVRGTRGPPPTGEEDRTRRRLMSARRRASRPWLLPLASILGGTIAVVLLAFSWRLLSGPPQLEPDLVVVDIFGNQTGDPSLDPVGAMTGHWLVQSLHAAGLRVVPFDVSLAVGRRVASADRAPDRLRQLAGAAGARLVVSGSYYREGEVLRLQAEIADAEKGEVVFAPDPVNAPVDSPSLALLPLRVDVRNFLFRYLNPAPVLDTIPSWATPPDFEAYRRFLVGMEHFLDTEWAVAFQHFQAAAQLDPRYPPFLYMSAIALGNQGRLEEAATYLTRLAEVEDRMTPYDRATVAWLRARTPHERLQAAQRMTEVGPSYVGFYVVAHEELALNRPTATLEVLDRPDVGPLLAPDWPLYWNVRVEALHALSRYKQELRAAREGLRFHPHAPELRGIELPALAALGRTGELLARAETLLALEPSGLDPLLAAGDELDAHGHPVEARFLWERLATSLDPLEEGSVDGRSLPLLLHVFERLGRDEDARRLLGGLQSRDSLAFLEHSGILAARSGDRERAETALAELSDPSGPPANGQRLTAQAHIAAELGEGERALYLLREALLRSGRYVSVRRDYHLRSLRNDPRFEELIRPGG